MFNILRRLDILDAYATSLSGVISGVGGSHTCNILAANKSIKSVSCNIGSGLSLEPRQEYVCVFLFHFDAWFWLGSRLSSLS